MKQDLAFKLIGEKLDWSDAELAREMRELQLMIDHKYDAYQGYQPATRFHVSLLNWVSQFRSPAERQTAYRFVKERLVFVSQQEMHHLVSLLMPIVVRFQRSRVASELKIPLYAADLDEKAIKRRSLLQRRTLYVGLSDGARIDVFRRFNEGDVSNEQVVAFSEISGEKWDNLRDELQESLKRRGIAESEAALFEVVCLVDDFSGSGSSLLRFKDGEWGGKVKKFYKANVSRIGTHLAPNCTLHIHHHLASDKAMRQIVSDLKAFAEAHPEFQYFATFSYVLPGDVVIDDQCSDAELAKLLQEHYNSKIQDKHTGKDIWYGYKSCGLPLVLEHNTPNNSIALLWATSEEGTPEMRPLFVRRKRHSSNG